MFRSVVGTVGEKVSSAYTSATTLFAKPAPNHQFIQLHTRFSSATEMSPVAAAIERLNDKKYNMKKLGDQKGMGSDEHKVHVLLDRLLDEISRHISDFNQMGFKDNYYANMCDLQALTAKLKGLVVTDDETKVLNSVPLDKPIAKNAAVTSALFAVPTIASSLLFGPIGGIVCVVGGALLSRPANDYLTENHIISWDTESMELVMAFKATVEKVNQELETYLADNKPAAELQQQAAIRPQ